MRYPCDAGSLPFINEYDLKQPPFYAKIKERRMIYPDWK